MTSEAHKGRGKFVVAYLSSGGMTPHKAVRTVGRTLSPASTSPAFSVAPSPPHGRPPVSIELLTHALVIGVANYLCGPVLHPIEHTAEISS